MKTAQGTTVDPEIGTLPERASAVKVHCKADGKWRMVVLDRDDAGQSIFGLGELPLHDVRAFAAFCLDAWGAGVYRVQFLREERGRMKLAGTSREVFVSAKKKKKKGADDAPPVGPLSAVAAERAMIAKEMQSLADQRQKMHEEEKRMLLENTKTIVDIIRAQPPPALAAAAHAGPTDTEIELRIELARLKEEKIQRRKRARLVRKLRAARRQRVSFEPDDGGDGEEQTILSRAVEQVMPAVRDAAPDLVRAFIEFLNRKPVALPPAAT